MFLEFNPVTALRQVPRCFLTTAATAKLPIALDTLVCTCVPGTVLSVLVAALDSRVLHSRLRLVLALTARNGTL